MKKQPLKYRLNVIGGALLVFLAVRTYIPLFSVRLGLDKNFTLWVISCIVTMALSCFLPVIFIEKMSDFNPHVLKKPVFTPESLAIITMCMFGFVLLGVVNSIVLFPLGKMGIVFPQQTLQTTNNVFVLILYFISLTLVPAVFEELFVRGTVLNLLLPYGKRFALISSAFIFMMMHTRIQSFLPVFGAGLVLGCVYLHTDNIFLSMALHFLNNSYSFVMMYIQQGRGGVSATAQAMLIIAAVIVTGLAGAMYLKSRNVDIFSQLEKGRKRGRYSAFLKSPVMVLALLVCLMSIGAQLFSDFMM